MSYGATCTAGASRSSRRFSHQWGWALTPYGKSVWFQLRAWL
ncbi:hypothetical protein AB0O28_26265 [Microbispora sp. NPDC088329]